MFFGSNIASHAAAGVFAVVVGLLAGQGKADAGSLRKTFSVPPAAVSPSGGASVSSAISLAGTGDSSFSFGFVLPADYRKDSRVSIFMPVSASGGPCKLLLKATGIVRARKGAQPSDESDGLSAKKFGVVEFGDQGVLRAATIFVRPGTDPVGQKAGDAMIVTVGRDAGTLIDTCGTSTVYGIEIRYRTAE